MQLECVRMHGADHGAHVRLAMVRHWQRMVLRKAEAHRSICECSLTWTWVDHAIPAWDAVPGYFTQVSMSSEVESLTQLGGAPQVQAGRRETKRYLSRHQQHALYQQGG